jgi:glycosyltransferase involved in cell wall biosynthesis
MDNVNNDIKVSVIMPIYNASRYLGPAIDSILDQTLPEIEIICVDDGSTDKSLEILKEYQKQDDRIRIVTQTNAGPAHARNNGIRRARGEYIAFLDADDFVEPTFLEDLYATASQDNLDIAICAYDMYNVRKARFETAAEAENAKIYSPGAVTSKSEYPDQIFTSTVNSAWNKLFSKSFVEKWGLSFLPDVRIYEDVYFVVTALSVAERVETVPNILMHHRIHLEQSRIKAFKKYHKHIPEVCLKIKEFLVKHGMYAPLSVSFANLSANRCYKTYNLLSSDEKEEFWNLLHGEYTAAFEWGGISEEDWADEEILEFARDTSLYDYDTYRKKSEKAGLRKREKIKGRRRKVSILQIFGIKRAEDVKSKNKIKT